MVTTNNAEFDGQRAKLYEQALREYPQARANDIKAMKRLLNPSSGEKILGAGEGNGLFYLDIANSVIPNGAYCVVDPSKDQLNSLLGRITKDEIQKLLNRVKLEQELGYYPQEEKNKELQAKRLRLNFVLNRQVAGIESMKVFEGQFDKVWSFGAFHHCPNQTEGMKRIYQSLKPGGLAVICDVFQGSSLAKYFDHETAKYSLTGHEVKFLSEDFAKSLCYLAGFEEKKVSINDLPQKWVFDSERDVGKFIYLLHGLTGIPGNEEEKYLRTLESCKNILGVSKNSSDKYELNWPMKVLKAIK